MKCFKTAFALLVISSFVGCANQQEQVQSSIRLPNWVVSPQVENGLADSACVIYSGHFTIDRDQAVALARNSLVQQIELRAASMTKTFQNRTDTVDGINIGANFESNARQIAEATLRGTKAEKVDLFQINGQKQLCVLVTLTEQKTTELAEQIMTGSGARLSSDDKRVLAEEFKADQGQKELLQAL